MTKYIVSKNADGYFTGFCVKSEFEKHPEAYFLEEGETIEEFEGPDPDGQEQTFDRVREIALSFCRDEDD